VADGLEIRLELEGDLASAIGSAITAATDLSPAMKEIANHLAFTTRQRFRRQAGPDGTPWKPSQRVLANPGERTLILHGDLVTSIRADWGKDYAAAGPEASGGAAIYAAIHQFGGKIRPRSKKALSFTERSSRASRCPLAPTLASTTQIATS
jgi:phage virion morphogenesis protein